MIQNTVLPLELCASFPTKVNMPRIGQHVRFRASTFRCVVDFTGEVLLERKYLIGF